MPQRRRLIAGIALSAVALAAPLAAPLAAQAQDTVTLRLHHFLNPQAPVPAKAIPPWIKKIGQESGGRIRVQVFPAMQLGGKPADLLGQAKDGVADIVWTVLGYTPGRFPKSEVFELPFISGNAETSSRAFHEYVQANAMDEFKDVKLLAAHTHGPGTFHSRKPIQALEDIKGRRVRGGSRTINMMLQQVGAVPVGMPVPQVSEALSKGVLDAATLPWEVVPSLKIEQIVRNHTGFSGNRGLYTQTFALLMNQAAYDKLPADLKKVIDRNSGADVSAMFGKALAEGDVAGMAAAQKSRNNIITLDAAETERWKQAAAGTREAWFREVKVKGIDGQRLAAEAERLVAAHEKK